MLRFLTLLLVGTLGACVPAPLIAQIGITEGNIEAASEVNVWGKPGVRNRSSSRGVEVRYEVEPGFNWAMDNGVLAGGEQKVTQLEQFTFKFKFPIVNKPRFKVLGGYEWDTEKYYFEDPYADQDEQTLFQLLDERRLKQNKLSLYVTRSLSRNTFLTGRFRLSLNGDYRGLWDFDRVYHNYSGGLAYGKKVSEDEEWSVGLSASYNVFRFIALPVVIYNKTFNDRWGIELGLPGQAFLRYNPPTKRTSSLIVGPKFYSKWYAINKDERQDFEPLGRFFLRNNAVQFMVHYQQNLIPWVWAYAEGGLFTPWNSRFTPREDTDLNLETKQSSRPFFRVGVFLTPPKRMMQ